MRYKVTFNTDGRIEHVHVEAESLSLAIPAAFESEQTVVLDFSEVVKVEKDPDPKEHGRYPYTYAYDYIRTRPGVDPSNLSRGQCAMIVRLVCEALLDTSAIKCLYSFAQLKETAASKLADWYIKENPRG